MNPRFECRSESKPRIPQNRNTFGRNSLQNENPLSRPRRSSSADRVRISIGAPRPRSLSEERKSVICNIRRSSIGLNENKILKDPRPLSDKGFQRKKVQELIEFMNEYAKYQTTASKLMPPSKKDFEIIFQSLANFFEPDFVVKRIEEDAPRILKTLRYPFIPPKSTFAYVARNNWPTLLGVLLYLMDLIMYVSCIDADMFFQSVNVDADHEHAILLKYIINSYCHHLDDQEKEAEVFDVMIRESSPYSIEELQQKNKELKALLKTFKKEMAVIQELKAVSAQHDAIFKQYEEYVAKMREHLEKKQIGIEKLSKQLAEKEAELNELKTIFAEKQAVYDAQGFDGKKQLCYFENQKRELLEKLQLKRAATNKITNDYYDAEMQYTKTFDECSSICDSFNESYLKVKENTAAIVGAIKNINDPTIKALCAKFSFELPDCNMLPSQKSIHYGNERKKALTEIKEKLHAANLDFNKIASKQDETLKEIFMRKSDLAIKIKVASSQEIKKEHDLNAEEKQALNEVKTIEAQCEELLKKLEDVRKEASEVKTENIALTEEYEDIIAMKKKKEKMYGDYLEKQNQMVARHSADIKALKEKHENYGKEIFNEISKILEELQE